MGIDFGVIWAANFDNAVRFNVRRSTRRRRVARRPPANQNSEDVTVEELPADYNGNFDRVSVLNNVPHMQLFHHMCRLI